MKEVCGAFMINTFKLKDNTSVIRQKGEFQYGCFKKAKHAKISEKQTVCVSGSKKCLFFGNFGALCFLEMPIFNMDQKYGSAYHITGYYLIILKSLKSANVLFAKNVREVCVFSIEMEDLFRKVQIFIV